MKNCHEFCYLYLKYIYFIGSQDVMKNVMTGIVMLRHNHVKSYDWGSSDPNCLINQLRNEKHEKYAQLWIGTHPKGPSKITQNESLNDYLIKREIKDLPFLYKILCIQKVLSIQLHPNKLQALKLNTQHPQIYDDNQKPEMFLTLSNFQCLFGIISQVDLDNLFTIQPFANLKSKKNMKIKEIIAEILGQSAGERKKCVDALLKNIQSVFPERKALVEKLQGQFPYDQGILISCLLKYKVLPPGQCFAIAAGVPHAYIKGTCLEIMKNSDNVVRLGLTPKLKDVKTMVEIMNDQIGLDGIKVQKTTSGFIWNNLVLNPVTVKEEESVLDIIHPSIGIIFDGTLQIDEFNFKGLKGDVFFIHPGKYQVKGAFTINFGGFSEQ